MACPGFYALHCNRCYVGTCSQEDANNPGIFNDGRWQPERVLNVSRTLEYQWLSKAGRYAMDDIFLARFSCVSHSSGGGGCFL